MKESKETEDLDSFKLPLSSQQQSEIELDSQASQDQGEPQQPSEGILGSLYDSLARRKKKKSNDGGAASLQA